MPILNRDYLLPENIQLLELRDRLNRERLLDIKLWPWWLRPCTVRVLLVVDGLDFSTDNFGLSTFATTLLDTGSPRFRVTLAHLGNVGGSAMMDWEPRIQARHARFAFDNPAQFTSDMYDVVFLFGIATVASQVLGGRPAADSGGNPYPNDDLAPAELQAIAAFQNSGGGFFATGDHGALGRLMGRRLPRAGVMRLWDHTVADPIADEDIDDVSMGGMRRNDTNQPKGHGFNDQSDDVPQPIEPKMYTATNFFWKYTFPHPLLCGPNGVIRVMPDHPHEGECVEPTNTSGTINFTGDLGPEFPPATDGGARPLPEVISMNAVLAGTTSGGKDPTLPEVFGGICAYDGHRAGTGRVVTDSTWHHFVNINLVGINYLPGQTPDPLLDIGFLASPAGQAHLQEIRSYFRNLAIWLSRTGNIDCMNWRYLTVLVRSERVLEAVLITGRVRLDQVSVRTLALIGRHARDVLGRFAGRCQARQLVIKLLWPEFIFELPEVDPWRPRWTLEELHARGLEREPGVLPPGPAWLDGAMALDVALGSALVAVGEAIDFGAEQMDGEAVAKAAREGARHGLARAFKGLREAMRDADVLIDRLGSPG